MSDLLFSTELNWHGTGREGEGLVKLAQAQVAYSAPDSMGGKGSGTSPEELLIAAVSTCYSGTLFGILRKEKLPVEDLSIRAEGMVTGYPMQSKFSLLRVSPTIYGGDRDRKEAYEQAARTARDKCFIGKTIAGNVDYEVGHVEVADSGRK